MRDTAAYFTSAKRRTTARLFVNQRAIATMAGGTENAGRQDDGPNDRT